MLCMVVLVLGLTAVVALDDQTIAVNFLNQYHYISQTRSGNHDVTTAIKHFQDFFHLPVTGALDKATVALMKKSRCGMPDGDVEGAVRKRRYVTLDGWGKSKLTYYVKYGEDLDKQKQDTVFWKAFQFWADQSSLSFSQVYSAENADIKISFGAKTHGGTQPETTCPYPFDGKGGVLAHAYYPEDGRAHFDEEETFTDDSPSGINLLWVATHEFGHSLGLEHTNVEGAIMYPYYTGYTANMKLHGDDIAGIQSLYGAPGSSRPTTQPTVPVCNNRLGGSRCLPYKKAGYCNDHPKDMNYWCYKMCNGC